MHKIKNKSNSFTVQPLILSCNWTLWWYCLQKLMKVKTSILLSFSCYRQSDICSHRCFMQLSIALHEYDRGNNNNHVIYQRLCASFFWFILRSNPKIISASKNKVNWKINNYYSHTILYWNWCAVDEGFSHWKFHFREYI